MPIPFCKIPFKNNRLLWDYIGGLKPILPNVSDNRENNTPPLR